MKTFTNMCRQGDVLIRRVNGVPDSAKQVDPVDGQYIVAHSETGHNHVLDAVEAVEMWESSDTFIAYITAHEPVELKHLRNYDTHESIVIEPGVFEVRRQREHIHEGFRRAAD